ncbi:hypothetical protein HETIRDRAFT_435469 [Heterobasidion irregulare TC 32-1]|uniref:WW domain-containing protein n=1 Tax=Heterobasidion irregulare (strain TC 32-1) TaxID=747525 RepID=W4K1A8_HETIT|nr:uncharacterized protein HETIRDRAFT_435469 [Heterobasidion irregulare TC 32-1]ETW78861.1 hypothetical protein HETIRDRAFT_435469 [Heterobasidion irregulare TC 32-1]
MPQPLEFDVFDEDESKDETVAPEDGSGDNASDADADSAENMQKAAEKMAPQKLAEFQWIWKTEHRNPEGRTYWFNTGTRESVWEKPDDLKSPFERALNQTSWKEYFSGGRKYYYNTQTKESKWDMPDELLLILEKVEKEGKAAPPAAPAPCSQSNALVTLGSDASSEQLNGQSTAVLPFHATSVLPPRPNLPDEPTIPHNGFVTVEEGEKAFTYLLRKAGIDANWTWDQTMRAIITDPLYKALNTLAEKKAAWQKYVDNLKAKEHEEREARLAKIRPAIRNMLKGNPNVFHYTTFPTADRLFAQHPIWQQAKIEAERRLIFEEYVTELKQRDVQEARAARSRATTKLVALFKQLQVDVLTRWRDAHSLVLESEQWRDDEDLQTLPNLDILLAFEDYSRVQEREFEEQMRRTQVEKTRKERKAREGFKGLLKDLVAAGRITARSKWKSVYPLFSTDTRYLDLLGKPGSNPIELFWDIVDELDQQLDSKIAIAESAIRRHNVKLEAEHAKSIQTTGVKEGEGEKEARPDNAGKEGPKLFAVVSETTEEEFVKVLEDNVDEALTKLTEQDMKEVFKTLRDQAVKQQADERRRAERKQRHMQDDLRYAIKKLPDAIDVNMSYEEAVPLIDGLPEYKVLDDEGRRAAFAKFIKRQKERLRDISEDGGSTTSRKRKEVPPHREPEREREKGAEKGGEKERDREHRDRDRDYDRERGGSRYRHHGHEETDTYHRSTRDHPRERERERDWDREHREKDRDRHAGYKGTTKHHREHDREDRRRRSREVAFDEKPEDRAEKRPRYERDGDAPPKEAEERPPERAPASVRAETPEEGEI